MRLSQALVCSFLLLGVVISTTTAPLRAQTVIEPGSGSPTDLIKSQFSDAYYRGRFPSIAALPPVATVARFGTTGLIQLYNDATRSGTVRLALVKANTVSDATLTVYQVLTDMYTYYNTVGVANAGYPTMDTQFCPFSACTWQLFDRKYALFAYTAGANETQNITVRDPFYSRWDFFGGINTLGPATTPETAVTGAFGGNATLQTYANGVIYNITTGALAGRAVTVREPFYTIYKQRGTQTGTLGYPTADEQRLANGRRRQTFEGGSIDYDDTTGPIYRAPVSAVLIQPATTPVRLNVGETLIISAAVTSSDGVALTDRAVNFISTNARVLTVTPSPSNPLQATVRAAGGGTARVSATSEGKASTPIDIIVASQCCAVGEGAPTASISQAFIDAVARARLSLRVPGPERVRRAGAGYVQEFEDAAGAGARYLVALADKSAQAFILSGPILARYDDLSGPAGTLGFPVADVTSAGRQLFENGALAGNPARPVTGAILTRWIQSNYEAGPPGLPVSEPSSATSFTASNGLVQAFAGGVIASGPRGSFFIRGAAATAWLDADGILSPLGFPISEEVASGGGFRQDFEGGTIQYSADAAPVISARPRTPVITATPNSALPGGRVRLTVYGFPDRANLRVSVTGQSDFLINTTTGAYAWEAAIAATAAPGTVTIRAVDTATNAATTATFTIRSIAQANVQLKAISGDTQSGAPGARLPAPLRVQLLDDRNTPVAGLTVRFTASPGAAVSATQAATNTSGIAETYLTLPSTDGIALVSAEAAGRVVTLAARAVGGAILGFPRLTAVGTTPIGYGTATIAERGALLAASASMLRHLQLRGDLRNPNGLADVAVLNEFLRRTCFVDSQGVQTCDGFLTPPGNSGEQIVNLWRLGTFAGGGLDLSAEKTDLTTIRALVAGGSPVMLALAPAAGGSHFVVAVGINPDGSLQIHDPAPTAPKANLDDYLSAGATLTGALRFLPRTPLSTSFVVSAASPIRLLTRSGATATECGATFEFPLAENPGVSYRQRACDGAAPEYQLEIGGDTAFVATVTDLSDGGPRLELSGSGALAFRVFRSGTALAITPQEAVLATANPVVNAATLTPDIAPGGLVLILGNGLARTGSATRVEIGGRAATVVDANPFAVRAQIPSDLTPGSYTLRLESTWGVVEQIIEVRPVAPAIFRNADGGALITNQNSQPNSGLNPARRSETVIIYATGLGATGGTGNQRPALTPVSVFISGQELRPSFAGLAPGFPGIYQINLTIPATFPPGLGQALTLRQGNADSQPVEISIL